MQYRYETPPVRSYRHPNAFSLLEILSSLAILSVLAVLLLPSAGHWREKAHETACSANLRRLHMAVLSYASDNDGRIPAGNTGSETVPTEAWAGTPLRQYIIENFQKGRNESIDRKDSPFTCPKARRARGVSNYPRTYGWNNYNRNSNGQIRLSNILQPSLTSLIIDGVHSSGSTWYQEVGIGSGSSRSLSRPEDFIHHGKVNILFVDGHVESRTKERIPTNPNHIFWLYSGSAEAL